MRLTVNKQTQMARDLLSELSSSGVVEQGLSLVLRRLDDSVCRLGLEYDCVKVLDFGLVKQEDRGTIATQLTRG